MSDFMVFFVTLEMAFFRSCKNQLSGWKFPHFRMSLKKKTVFSDSKVESAWHGESCESHEGCSCWFWNSYPFLHMTESQRGSAITHGSLVRFIFHTFSLIPLTCSSVERLDGLALIQEIQEIQEIDSNICQVLDIPITTTHTHTHTLSLSPITPRIKKQKERKTCPWTRGRFCESAALTQWLRRRNAFLGCLYPEASSYIPPFNNGTTILSWAKNTPLSPGEISS